MYRKLSQPLNQSPTPFTKIGTTPQNIRQNGLKMPPPEHLPHTLHFLSSMNKILMNRITQNLPNLDFVYQPPDKNHQFANPQNYASKLLQAFLLIIG